MQIAWRYTGLFGLSRGDVFIQGPAKYNQTVNNCNDYVLGSNQDERGELSFPMDSYQKTRGRKMFTLKGVSHEI